MNPNPAYLSVRVNFQNSDYRNVCDAYGGGFDRLPSWQALGNLLAHRTGWHFDVDQNAARWCLGVFGECQLAIYVNDDLQYHCYDHRQDSDTIAPDTAALETWLNSREEIARQPSPTLMQWVSTDSWKYLKLQPIQLQVSWSDGYFSSSLSYLGEASFGRTLGEAVNGAGEMICQLFGAPEEIARELNLSAELDASALQHIRSA